MALQARPVQTPLSKIIVSLSKISRARTKSSLRTTASVNPWMGARALMRQGEITWTNIASKKVLLNLSQNSPPSNRGGVRTQLPSDPTWIAECIN